MAVEAEDVLAIIDTSVSKRQISSRLVTAEAMVATHIDGHHVTVTSELRDEIKKYLAAHFVAIEDPRVRREEADGIRTTFEGKDGMGLESTRYGQQVLVLDPTGALRKLNNASRKTLNFHVGKDHD